MNDTRNYLDPHGLIVWFTGLSGTGKTTISCLVKKKLEDDGFRVLVLDGDDVRERLHRNLGFTKADIIENNRLISELCLDERSAQNIIMVPIISPYRESRAAARERLSPGFFEVHVSADIPVLEQRDTKGLYARAKNREIDNLIGYSPGAPYEPPLNAEITLETEHDTTDACAQKLYEAIIEKL